MTNSAKIPLQVARPNHLIDLAVGHPDPDLLPVELFNSLSPEQLSFGYQNLAYGEQAGAEPFRQMLAAWLAEDYGQPIKADELLVTNGSSNALDMICSLLRESDATVLVEDPCYFIALKLFKARGFNVVAVPMDEEGIELQALEQAIEQYNPAFIYTIPTFHNPTGITQSDNRRRALVKLAADKQCVLVADEVYQSLYFDQKPPAPLACYNRDAPVLSIGSFSKILAPGLRLGWIQASGELLYKLTNSALLFSGGGLAPVTSALVGALIAKGEFQNNLAHLRQTYAARSELLYDGLVSTFGDQIQIKKPEGGYFLWAHFVDGRDVAAKRDQARELSVNYLPGNLCSATGQFRSSMRLCFAWYPEQQLITACERLGEVLT
ncbi:PLP-dependent aminotransferase family protein [Oceanospirillum beijerinckii]|uniref:aminotransferase-like domain-containing protein n=1 Tax=Oceanospirillum beijerinckii TaxID=64976 RepID=UPI0012FF3D9D|nr:PLP-dependent aminotransferase family protein [Oceanospirillum beijerinckii]